MRNRREVLEADGATGGVRCAWRFTSDLHIANVSRIASTLIMRAALREHPIQLSATQQSHGTPTASFIIGHRGRARLPLLLKTIESIAAQSLPVECIVVEQAATPVAGPQLPSWVKHIHQAIASDDAPYNRSETFNIGARAARSNLLVFHDNDILVPEDYAAAVAGVHAQGWEFIDLKRFVFYLSEAQTNEVLRATSVPSMAAERITQNMLAGGSVGADRDAFFAIGGFDESFSGWGGEDNDFWDRAATRATWSFATLPFVHLWHAPQREKITTEPSGGRARMLEIENVPPEERIRRLTQR